jgi:hypothetical protein
MVGEVFQQSSHVASQDVGDELIVYDPDARKLYVLNWSAARVWALLDGRHTVVEVADKLRLACDGDPETILANVRETIAYLEGRNLVVRCN